MTGDVLDPLIHVPARLRIVVTLAALNDGDTLSFTRLQDMIKLTPGNLITHLRKLEEAGYVDTEKTGNGVASRTSVALTHRGRAALDVYAEALRGFSASCREPLAAAAGLRAHANDRPSESAKSGGRVLRGRPGVGKEW